MIYRNDLPDTPEEVFFRILLFKVFNRIETWEMLEKTLGMITWEEYEFNRYDQVLSQALARDERIYSAAYICPRPVAWDINVSTATTSRSSSG